MFAKIYNIIANLDDIKEHTAILSLTSLIEENYKVDGESVKYKKGTKYNNHSDEALTTMINNINNQPIRKIPESIIKNFVSYYRYFQLYLFDIYGDKTALDFYPEEFFKIFVSGYSVLIYSRIFELKENIFIPSYTHINRDIYDSLIYERRIEKDSRILKEYSAINPMIKEYFKSFEVIINWRNGDNVDIHLLINDLAQLYGGTYKAAFVLMYNLFRFIYFHEINNKHEELYELGISDIFGFHKLLFKVLFYIFGYTNKNFEYGCVKYYKNGSMPDKYKKIIDFKNPYEYLAFGYNLGLSEPIANIDKIFKILRDELENGNKITSYLEQKYNIYLKGVITRQFINILIITNNKELFKRMLLIDPDIKDYVALMGSNAYWKCTENEAKTFTFIIDAPLYLTTDFYTILRNMNDTELLYNFVSVCLNPEIMDYHKNDMDFIKLTEPIKNIDENNRYYFNPYPGYYSTSFLYTHTHFGYTLENLSDSIRYYYNMEGVYELDGINAFDSEKLRNIKGSTIFNGIRHFIYDATVCQERRNEIETYYNNIIRNLNDSKEHIIKTYRSVEYYYDSPYNNILQRLDEILQHFKTQIDFNFIETDKRTLWEEYKEEVIQIVLHLNCFFIKNAYELCLFLLDNNILLNYIFYIKHSITYIGDKQFTFSFYNQLTANTDDEVYYGIRPFYIITSYIMDDKLLDKHIHYAQSIISLLCSMNDRYIKYKFDDEYKWIYHGDEVYEAIQDFNKYITIDKFLNTVEALNSYYYKYRKIELLFMNAPNTKIENVLKNYVHAFYLLSRVGFLLLIEKDIKGCDVNAVKKLNGHGFSHLLIKEERFLTITEITKHIKEWMNNKNSIISKATKLYIDNEQYINKLTNDKLRDFIYSRTTHKANKYKTEKNNFEKYIKDKYEIVFRDEKELSPERKNKIILRIDKSSTEENGKYIKIPYIIRLSRLSADMITDYYRHNNLL